MRSVSFSRAPRCVPAADQKTAENGYFIIGEFGSLTINARRPLRGPGRHLPTGYPQVINNGGVWEFEPNSPLEYDLMLLWSEQVLDLLTESSLELLGL